MTWPVALLAAVVVGIVGLTTPPVPLNDGWDADGRFYGLMLLVFEGAAGIGEIPGPWRWRPLSPFLASLLPFDPLTSFRILGMLSAGAGLLLLHALARRTGLSPRAAVLAMVLYAGLFWTVKFPAWSPAYVDAETQLLLLAGLLLAWDGRTGALVALMSLAGLQKASLAILAVPAWIAWSRRSGADPFGRAGLLRLAALAAVPVAVGVTLRLTFPLPGGAPRPPGPLEGVAALLAADGTTVRLAVALMSGLGLLWALPLAAPGTAVAFLRSRPFWAVQIPLGCILLVGGVDKARLFLYMAPAMAVLGAETCRVAHREIARSTAGLGAAWLAATLVVHLWLGHHLEPLGNTASYLSRMAPVHAASPPLPWLVTAGAGVGAWGALTAALLLRARALEEAPEEGGDP